MAAPTRDVLAAFGATGAPVPLDGGRGTSWRCGDLVLKPIAPDEHESHRWLGSIAEQLTPSPLRLALPAAASDGRLIVDGWTATRYLEGEPSTDWMLRAEVARDVAHALRSVDAATLPTRSNPWSIADRLSWAEATEPSLTDPVMDDLRPIDRAAQLVHGDITGNVLVAPGLPPAVIDLTIYARPVEWSVAVLGVDVVSFENAPASVLDTISADPDFRQLVIRALLYRAFTDQLNRVGTPHNYAAVRGWISRRR